MMVPIGGSTFIMGRMEVSPKALVKIGLDLLVEKDIPDAIQTLKCRSEDLERGLSDNEKRLKALQEKEWQTVAQIEDLKSLLSTTEQG
jgi:prefoldin subunit 5